MEDDHSRLKDFNRDQIDLVIYHANCADGYGGAFCVWYYYKNKYGINNANNIRYLPSTYDKNKQTLNNNFYKKFIDKNVIIIDFSYKSDIMKEIMKIANSVMILDHHISAMEDLKPIPEKFKIYDLKKSGAVIAWNYFFGDEKIPQVLLYIQDRDLWTNELPNSNYFVSYFYEKKFTFSLFEDHMDNNLCNQGIEIGKQWVEYKDIIVEKNAKYATKIMQKINNQYVIISYQNTCQFASEIGNKIIENDPITDCAVMWYYKMKDNITIFSLRSADDRIDVSKLAQLHDGGGHRNAAGVRLSGLCAILPHPEAHKLYLDLLESATIKEIIVNNDIMSRYLLFDCKNIGDKFWRNLDPLFIELLSRKNPTVELFVFQKIKNESGKFFKPNYHIVYNKLLDDSTYKYHKNIFHENGKKNIKIDSFNKIGESLGKKISDYEYNLFEYFEETYMKTILIAN